MKCPYCNEFQGNTKVRGYPVKEQLQRHIEVHHYKPVSLFELREAVRPIEEREETKGKERIATFLTTLAPKNYGG